MELNGFSDSSEKAYAAVAHVLIYVIIKYLPRASQLKRRLYRWLETTIPRLELMASVILSKLLKTIINSFTGVYELSRVVCWTDNMDTYFINRDKVWNTFVHRRVSKIRNDLPLAEWRHCPGELNPADLPSRGLDLNSHERLQKWLHGPDFLFKDEEIWPQIPLSGKEVVELPTDNELVKPKHCFVVPAFNADLIQVINLNRYSHVTKLFRATSYVLRFVKNLKRPENCFTFQSGESSTEETTHAKGLWIINQQKRIIAEKKRLND